MYSFSDVGKIVGQGIKKATALEHLDISNNPLTAEDVVDLLNSVVLPTSLKSLGITHVFVDEQLEKVSPNNAYVIVTVAVFL